MISEGKVTGMVSLGDLVIQEEPVSTLAEISKARASA